MPAIEEGALAPFEEDRLLDALLGQVYAGDGVTGDGTMLTIVVHDNLVLNENGVDGSKPVERHLYVLKILFMETDDDGNTFVVAIQRLPEEPARLLYFTFPMNQSLWVYPSWLHGRDAADVEG